MTLDEKKKIDKRMIEIENLSETEQRRQVYLGEIPPQPDHIVDIHPAYLDEYRELDDRLKVAYEEEQED
jgi:hypothetical protein